MRRYLIYILLALVSLWCCGGADKGDFAAELLKQQPYIETLHFSNTTFSKQTDGIWLVDNNRKALSGRLEAWWTMLHNLHVRPLYLDDASFSAIEQHLKDSGVHVVAQDKKGKLLVDFYLQHFSNIGTIALVDNATYLLDLAYENVDIMDYWSTGANDWQDMTVLAFQPAEIQAVGVDHYADSLASFRLIRESKEQWKLFDGKEQEQNNVNEELIDRYSTYFQSVKVEKILSPDDELLSFVTDKNLQYTIKLLTGGRPHHLHIYGLPLSGKTGYDTDKCLVYIVETQETAIASWVSFDLLLKNLKDFVDKK